MILRLLMIALFCVCGSCSTESHQRKHNTIGRDPTWFPLDFKLQTANINAFTNSLVDSISHVEHYPMRIFDANWISLYQDLEEEKYAAVFTSLPMNRENQDRYTFSDPFLLIGPVLVVPENSSATSLKDFGDKNVGINQFDDTILIVQKYPTTYIKLYQNMPIALEDLAAGRIDAVLINTLEAHALVPNLYPGTLKIVSDPLTDKGLRMITLKGENEKLIKHFNAGLKKLQTSGQYQELREKFTVN